MDTTWAGSLVYAGVERSKRMRGYKCAYMLIFTLAAILKFSQHPIPEGGWWQQGPDEAMYQILMDGG